VAQGPVTKTIKPRGQRTFNCRDGLRCIYAECIPGSDGYCAAHDSPDAAPITFELPKDPDAVTRTVYGVDEFSGMAAPFASLRRAVFDNGE